MKKKNFIFFRDMIPMQPERAEEGGGEVPPVQQAECGCQYSGPTAQQVIIGREKEDGRDTVFDASEFY